MLLSPISPTTCASVTARTELRLESTLQKLARHFPSDRLKAYRCLEFRRVFVDTLPSEVAGDDKSRNYATLVFIGRTSLVGAHSGIYVAGNGTHLHDDAPEIGCVAISRDFRGPGWVRTGPQRPFSFFVTMIFHLRPRLNKIRDPANDSDRPPNGNAQLETMEPVPCLGVGNRIDWPATLTARRQRQASRPAGRPARRRRPVISSRPRVILLNKPFNVLCQFHDEDQRPTLADFIDIPDIYPAGRLDRDSEGLVVLTNHGPLQHRLSDPRYKRWKTYWVQVEGRVDSDTLRQLADGIELKDGPTRPARARALSEPVLWPRDPPIRQRKTIPTDWLELSLREGRNRQVRRMTAAVGLPTLRLVRYAIGDWTLDGLAPGQWRELSADEIRPE